MRNIIISIILIIFVVLFLEPKQLNKTVEHPYYPGEAWTQESLNYNLELLNKLK